MLQKFKIEKETIDKQVMSLMLKAEIIHTTSKSDKFLMVLWKPLQF